MPSDSSFEPVLLLGRDHLAFTEYACVAAPGSRAVGVISVGADPRAPSRASKGDPLVPNEDALLVVDDGNRVLLAVADAHYGCQASHEILAAIAKTMVSIPAAPPELESLMEELVTDASPSESASTLLLAVHDRQDQQGFGVSFGDSSLVLVGQEGAWNVNIRGSQYVSAHEPHTYRPSEGYMFRFLTGPDQLLLAFTDGINECHYRSPQTSVTPDHLRQIFDKTGPDPVSYAQRLVELALAGIDGNPGGQDNIALAVSRT